MAILRGAPRIRASAIGALKRQVEGSVQPFSTARRCPRPAPQLGRRHPVNHLQVIAPRVSKDDYEGFVRELRFGAMTPHTFATVGRPEPSHRRPEGLLLPGARVRLREYPPANSSMTMHAGVSVIPARANPCVAAISNPPFWPNFRARPPKPLRLRGSAAHRASISAAVSAVSQSSSAPRWPLRAGLIRPEPSSVSNSWISSLWRLASGPTVRDGDSVRRARLRSVKSYIDEHGDPHLSLRKIAEKTGFRCATSINCFVQSTCRFRMGAFDACSAAMICYSPAAPDRSITEIAYSMGFSSSSHFLFRGHFGLRPSDVRGGGDRRLSETTFPTRQ